MLSGIRERWRTIFAILIAIVFIGGAYVLGHGLRSPNVAQASTETALLEQIATKDSNGDGLPDWEKTLYGIPVDATTTDYFHLGMTDGEAVAKGLIVPKAVANIPTTASTSPDTSGVDGLPPPPADGTITEIFSQDLLGLYISAEQSAGPNGLTQTDLLNIAQEAFAQLSSTVAPAPDFKSISDLTVSGSGANALTAFAISAENVLNSNTGDATGSELTYLQQVLQTDSQDAIKNLTAIAKIYRQSAIGLAELSVPQELAQSDLEVINAMARISEIITDFSRVDTDPLATILALNQYPSAVQALAASFSDVANTYATAGISIPEGNPGAEYVNVITEANSQQPTTP